MGTPSMRASSPRTKDGDWLAVWMLMRPPSSTYASETWGSMGTCWAGGAVNTSSKIRSASAKALSTSPLRSL